MRQETRMLILFRRYLTPTPILHFLHPSISIIEATYGSPKPFSSGTYTKPFLYEPPGCFSRLNFIHPCILLPIHIFHFLCCVPARVRVSLTRVHRDSPTTRARVAEVLDSSDLISRQRIFDPTWKPREEDILLISRCRFSSDRTVWIPGKPQA